MANTASAFGQLQRAGISKAPNQKKKKKFPPNWSDRQKAMHKRMGESRIRESLSPSVAFMEQGQDVTSKQPDGKKGKNRVYLVTIIEEGMGNSKDKNYYSKEALTQGAQLFNGTKAYADHPDAISEKTLPERSMKDLVGWYSDCIADKNPTTGKVRVRGKLHFFPAAKWLTDMIDTILTDPTAKGLFGISINAIGKTRPAHANGDMINYVESFQRVDSADVVTEPAARGKFEKILESRAGVKGRVVNKHMSARLREGLSPRAIKKLADTATAAYNSDNPDEMKQALYEVQKDLYAESSISGKGPGQSNEEQYSNVNPAGGNEMNRTRQQRPVRASGKRMVRRKKRIMTSDGTGPDNETLPEPSPDDTPTQIHESDVEDEEGSDLGDMEDYGDADEHVEKHHTREALGDGRQRRPARPAARRAAPVQTQEDEGMEGLEDEGMEDEGFEDEGMEGLEDEGMEDENMPPSGGGAGGGGGSMPSPSAMGPGSSRMVTAAHDDQGDGDQDDGQGQDDAGMDDDLGEAEEVGEDLSIRQPARRPQARTAMGEAGRRRRTKTKETQASFKGGLGSAGDDSLPSHAVDDYDEDYKKPDRDRSTSGVGKSYKIKTSIGQRNKPVHPRMVRQLVHEANRRIGILESGYSRLRESVRAKERVISRYQGIIDFHNRKVSAKRLLESAVRQGYFGENEEEALAFARTIEPKLYRLNRGEQKQEIRIFSRLRESAAGAAEERLLENVEGVGARGGAVSRGTAVDGNSGLAQAMAEDGIPFREE